MRRAVYKFLFFFLIRMGSRSFTFVFQDTQGGRSAES